MIKDHGFEGPAFGRSYVILILLQRHTRGKMLLSTGVIYDGEFVNDVICGEGEMRYSPSCKYQGSWINGLVSLIEAHAYFVQSSYLLSTSWLQLKMRPGMGGRMLVDIFIVLQSPSFIVLAVLFVFAQKCQYSVLETSDSRQVLICMLVQRGRCPAHVYLPSFRWVYYHQSQDPRSSCFQWTGVDKLPESFLATKSGC